MKTDEKIIRKHFIKKLQKKTKDIIINELATVDGKGRIDIATLGDEFVGYEIKSDKDSLQRLKSQVEAFDIIYDKITVIVGSSHLLK